MKVLITGGAGFIGTNFTYYCFNTYPDCEVAVLDKLTYAGRRENLARLEDAERFQFFQTDLVDKKAVFEIFEREKFDIVVNFAAESHVDRSIENPSIFMMTNIVGTHNLLEASLEFGVKRFHQISTDEVYGDLGDNSHDFFTETSPLKPSSPYSSSKASADLVCLAYHRTYRLPVTISRCSNNYGPYQFPEKLIPYFYLLASKGEKLPVYGDGKNIRDWIYVEDHCKAVDVILEHGRAGEIYNVGGNCEKNNLEVVKEILKFLSKDESLIEFVEDRKGHDRRYAIDNGKMFKEFGWKPKTSFSEGLKKTLGWYKKASITTSKVLRSTTFPLRRVKKILILGAGGMLGADLVKAFSGEEVIGWTHEDFDMTDRNSFKKILQIKPDVIINSAAYTAVDKAEEDVERAFKINADAITALSRVADKCGAVLVNFSTDYVFSGEKKGGYTENDVAEGALNVYGKSKAQGEKNLTAKKHYLIRTSWLFGKNGKNFVKTMLESNKPERRIVSDQIGKPTYAADLAEAVRELIDDMPEFGIYHLVNEGPVSWYEFAKEIFEMAGVNVKVTAVASSEFVRLAKRPKNSVLENTKRPHLRSHLEALRDYLKEIA